MKKKRSIGGAFSCAFSSNLKKTEIFNGEKCFFARVHNSLCFIFLMDNALEILFPHVSILSSYIYKRLTFNAIIIGSLEKINVFMNKNKKSLEN